MHLSQSTGITGRIRRAYTMWPRRRLIRVLRRVVNTLRFLKTCHFATLVLPRRTFTERRLAVKSPTALLTRLVAMASLQCRAQPLSLNKELSPNPSPRLDLG